MQNEQKLAFPICLCREAMRLQCFPPTRYVKWARILCLNNWRSFTTWLCKALICSIIDVLQYACTCFCFFSAKCRFLKKANLIHTLELKLWHLEVFPYVCMWKPCVCNVSPPTLRECALFRKLVLLACRVWPWLFCVVSRHFFCFVFFKAN